MMEIRKTAFFAQWLDDLRDLLARACVQTRIERLAAGNPGDIEPVGEGVSELRINYGPGYRVYFKKQGQDLIIASCWPVETRTRKSKTSKLPCAAHVIFWNSRHD